MNVSMQQVASSSAKSVLGTSAELEPNQWLAKVCDGRRDDDRALLAHALDEFAAVADHEANGTELIQRGLSIGTILHDLEMDAATVAVGVLMALPAGISTSSVARRLGESVGDLASLVERLSSIAELHEAPRDALQTERLRKLLLTMVNDVRRAYFIGRAVVRNANRRTVVAGRGCILFDANPSAVCTVGEPTRDLAG